MDEELLIKKEEVLKQIAEKKVNILSQDETLDLLLSGRKSIARFGDGELKIINGNRVGFQEENAPLGARLKEVLCSNQDFCLIGVIDELNGFENRKQDVVDYWINYLHKYRKVWLDILDENKTYCSANITRPYIAYVNHSNVEEHFKKIKRLWENKDVVICEGELTRLGIGNDLLDNCKSVKRVLCPPTNAYDKYEDIINTLRTYPKDTLVLLALGPTATVLAFDLAKDGYQALDIGHIDIEYEWFLRKATSKERIENKYVNEAPGGRVVGEIKDEKYEKQIEHIIK